MVTGPWGSIATFIYFRIWNFSTVLTKNKFPGGKFLNLSTVKPFSCNMCNKLFGSKYEMIKHVKQVHEKLKLFSCSLCDKSFVLKTDLTRHVDSVHRKLKPFTCTLCDISFGLESPLINHVKQVHEKLKPFSCTLCDKSFGQKETLKRHVKSCFHTEVESAVVKSELGKHNIETKDGSDNIHEHFDRDIEMKQESMSEPGIDSETMHLSEKSETLIKIDKDHEVYLFSGDGKSELSLPTHETHTHHDNNVIKTEPLFLQDDNYMIKTQASLSNEETLNSISVSEIKTEKKGKPVEVVPHKENFLDDISLQCSSPDNALPLKDEDLPLPGESTADSKDPIWNTSRIQCHICDGKYDNILDYTNPLKVHSGNSQDFNSLYSRKNATVYYGYTIKDMSHWSRVFI